MIDNISLMIQCRHKIALREKFHLNDFDYRHHFREQCMGFQIIPNNITLNESTIDVNNFELSVGKPKDDNDYVEVCGIGDTNTNFHNCP
jgi:hypothetical protein